MIHEPITLMFTGFKHDNHNEKVSTPVRIDHKRKFRDMWTLHVTFLANPEHSNYIPLDYMEAHCHCTIDIRKITTA